MNTALKFGLATPSNFWKLDWPERQQTVAQIADSGFDHMFMADHVSFRNGSGTDGFVEVAGLSQLHPSLGVMTGIYLLPLRHPLPVARQLASMANLNIASYAGILRIFESSFCRYWNRGVSQHDSR